MPDIVVASDLPPPLVDFVPTLQWYTLQAGLGNMLKKITTIVAAGASQLNGSPSTYNEVYVNAPGPVTITMPHDNLLIQGQEWSIKDASGHAFTNNITVVPSTSTDRIDGAGQFVLNSNWASLTLTWNGTGYSIKV